MQVSTGHGPLERFDVVRVQRTGLGALLDDPVMLVAPFGFPASFWEISALSDYGDSFAARVARGGYDVWLVDSRIGNNAPGSCESGAVNCNVMAGWGIDNAVEDVMFVRQLVRLANVGKKPVIGGVSGGSSTALATINRHGNHFSGLFLWEGTLYSDDPDVRARNAAFCEQDEAMLAAGQYVDPSVQGFRTLFDIARAAPSDPSPIPLFPPGTTNLQALLFALTLPDPNNPLNFTDDFIRFVGDPIAATLTYSDLDRVMEFGALIGTYAPVRFIRDSHCAMGGVDSSFTNRLHQFKGKVLVFAEELGFGQMMLDTAARMTRAQVSVSFNPGFGESDRYFNHDWVALSVNPLLAWLDNVPFRGH
jgi:pimeloyl-ACP methyl ester carboxylesterase